MMKRFYCWKCDEYTRTARTDIVTTVDATIYVDANGHITADYESGDLKSVDLNGEFFCACGTPVTITEEPCDHRWGETTYGYGDAEGKTKHVCRDCGKIEFGTGIRPVWE